MRTLRLNTSGFSLLVAIGTIAVLLVIVSSLAVLYIRETKLSRYLYDDLIASSNAEGMYEYAMLKIRNHRDGFEDSVSKSEPDGALLAPSLQRSQGLQGEYFIEGASTGSTFTLSGGDHLIIPLFASSEVKLDGGVSSKKPSYHTGTLATDRLSISGMGTLDWTLIATKDTKTLALAGKGDIHPDTTGTIRVRTSKCYRATDGNEIPCDTLGPNDEELVYSYEDTKTVGSFLSETSDAYFVLYNSSVQVLNIQVSSATPFSLPTLTVTAKSQKGSSSQIYQFTEDKAKYYDALKYGVYNTGP